MCGRNICMEYICRKCMCGKHTCMEYICRKCMCGKHTYMEYMCEKHMQEMYVTYTGKRLGRFAVQV
jgi:hypothetical protein